MDSTNDSTIREIENMRQMFGGGGSFGSPSLSGGASKLFLTLALVLMIVGGFNWFFTIFGQYYYDIRNGEAGGLVPDYVPRDTLSRRRRTSHEYKSFCSKCDCCLFNGKS